MSKIKIHELAKELNVASKDVVEYLKTNQVEVKSHMSSIEDTHISMVRDKFKQKENKTINNKDENHNINEVKTEAASVESGDRPKKKPNITAVFNPQNSKQGNRRPAGNQTSPQGNKKPIQQSPSSTASVPTTKASVKKEVASTPTEQVEKETLNPVSPKTTKPVEKEEVSSQSMLMKPVMTGPKKQGNIFDNMKASEASKPAVKTGTGERRPYNNNGTGTGERRPYNNNGTGTGERRPYNNNGTGTGERRPYNNNGTGTGERRPYNNNGTGTGERRPYNNNGTGTGERRPYNNNGTGERRPYNNNGTGTGERRPYNNNGTGQNRPAGEGNRPFNNGTGARPSRPQGDRPYENRAQGDRSGQRPYTNNRPNTGYSQGNRSDGGNYQNRPGQPRTRVDSDSAAPKEDIRGKESRERSKNAVKTGVKKPDFNKKGEKKKENFVNLEKKTLRKKPQNQQKPEAKVEEIKTIYIPEMVTIRDLAERMKIQASVIIKKLFLQGTMVTVNHELDFDAASEIALEYNCVTELEEKVDVIAELLKEEDEKDEHMIQRAPVVCVMGHVDHGKTSLLDAIRSTKVTDREAGGITQHIGASVVSINNQPITFLDTPGHEAFTAMRMRGANATDIAILVVAADDGVMPQTVEAINHAKAAGIEIIVAVNKIDKPSANIERVKQELSEHQLISEDWGGSTIFVPVSAHTKEGIETLLEMILLTAEILELKANPDRNARGLVIEAQLDKGRGAVATVLVQKGTLRVGEPIACGSCYGKVRAMIDDNGKRVKEAGPSTPVEILGLSGVPNAGEIFVSTDSEKEARSFAETFVSEGKERLLEDTKAKMSLDDLFSQIKSGTVKELCIIVKADVQGSVEAVKQSLEKLSNEEVIVKIIHGGVGAINESDVILASASNAIIIGFNVRPDVTAKATAEREKVDVRLYKVIYNAIEDVEAAMKGMLDPIFEEKILGHAEVRQVISASGIGNIAGSYILDGIFERGSKVRITREGKQIFEGELASLKRFKDDVKEVKHGYECGIVIDGFNEIEEFDQLEAYKMVEVPR